MITADAVLETRFAAQYRLNSTEDFHPRHQLHILSASCFSSGPIALA